MRTWTGVYEDRKKNQITVKSVQRPPKVRSFRVAGGKRRFKLVTLKTTLREVIIVAKGTKTRKKAVEEDVEEIESLEDLEDDDVEDEDEPEAVEDDEDEDEDEPAPKSKKGKAKAAAAKTTRAKSNGRVGSAEIAEAAGVDARTLRMVLRKHSVEKDEESGRYEWDSLKDPEVKKILKWIKAGEADDIKKESLDRLKAKKAADKAKAEKKSGKGKKGKKAKKVVEDEDEDDD